MVHSWWFNICLLQKIGKASHNVNGIRDWLAGSTFLILPRVAFYPHLFLVHPQQKQNLSNESHPDKACVKGMPIRMARGKEGEGGVKVWGELNTSLRVWDLQLMVGDSFSENQFLKLLSPISLSIKKKKKKFSVHWMVKTMSAIETVVLQVSKH